MELSPGADLLLLTTDPAGGGLVAHKRGRLRKALKAAGSSKREARAELREAGLLEDRAAAGRRFARLRKQLASGEFESPRERELALLAAWTGSLAPRLSRDEWRLAYRRLRTGAAAGREPEQGPVREAPLSGQTQITEGIAALGAVAALGGGAVLMSGVDSPHDMGGGFESGGTSEFGG